MALAHNNLIRHSLLVLNWKTQTITWMSSTNRNLQLWPQENKENNWMIITNKSTKCILITDWNPMKKTDWEKFKHYKKWNFSMTKLTIKNHNTIKSISICQRQPKQDDRPPNSENALLPYWHKRMETQKISYPKNLKADKNILSARTRKELLLQLMECQNLPVWKNHTLIRLKNEIIEG